MALASPENYSYTYDLMGRKERVNYPPAVNGGAGGTSEAFDYDTVGRLWHFTTRGGNIQTFTYDALHRQKGFTWDDGGVTPGVTFGYDIASRLISIVNPNATITRAYFDDNLLKSETEAVLGGPTSTVTYGYDADGNRDSLVYPNNAFSFAYTYTGRNQLKSVRNTAVSSPTATYGYNVNGSLISRALNNSTSSSYGYDALGRVEDISHVLTGETRSFSYDYDSVGRRKWAQRDNARGDVFGYDLNDEVTATKLNILNPATTGAGAPTISYDANGNRNTFAAYGATDTYTTNNLSQYTSRDGVNAIYGPKGNLGSFGAGTNYIYDSQNRLTSATDSGNTFTFKYDGLNRQVSRKLNAGAPVYSVWDGWELIEEVQNGSVTAAYLNGATGLIKDLVANRFYYQDGSGSTSHLADNNGVLLEWYRYDLQGTPIVYGPADFVRTGGSSYAIRHLFTGQQWIKELGLYDLRNRFYSPDLGRFLQPDPIGFGGDPTNLYRYCGGDPVNAIDPSGLDQHTISLGYGVGLIVTWGTNNGISNSGAYLGVGYGAAYSYNPSNSTGQFFASNWGFAGQYNQGAGRFVSVNGSAISSSQQNTVTLTSTLGYTKNGVQVGVEEGIQYDAVTGLSATPVTGTVSYGYAGVAGFGATNYGMPTLTPPTEPRGPTVPYIPPPTYQDPGGAIYDANGNRTGGGFGGDPVNVFSGGPWNPFGYFTPTFAVKVGGSTWWGPDGEPHYDLF